MPILVQLLVFKILLGFFKQKLKPNCFVDEQIIFHVQFFNKRLREANKIALSGQHICVVKQTNVLVKPTKLRCQANKNVLSRLCLLSYAFAYNLSFLFC